MRNVSLSKSMRPALPLLYRPVDQLAEANISTQLHEPWCQRPLALGSDTRRTEGWKEWLRSRRVRV